MDIIEEEIQKFVDRYAVHETVRRSMELDLHLFTVKVIQDFRKMMVLEDTSYTPDEKYRP